MKVNFFVPVSKTDRDYIGLIGIGQSNPADLALVRIDSISNISVI